MRAELANLNQCALPFLSRADDKLFWYSVIMYLLYTIIAILYTLYV